MEQRKHELLRRALRVLPTYINNAFGDKSDIIYVSEILALLKTEEPHIMSINEIEALEDGDVVWIEFSDNGELLPMMIECGSLMRWGYLWKICKDAFYDENYRARAWSTRPTKEQMEATPWK